MAVAARVWGLDSADGLELAPGQVRDAVRGGRLTLAQLAATMTPEERTVVETYQAPTTEQRLTEDKMVTILDLPHRVFSFAAHLARVEMDQISRRVEVKDYLAATDCGQPA